MQEKWLTIGEVSERTGKSTAAVRMWIKRRTIKGEQVRVKKERGKHCESWLIHSSEIADLTRRDSAESSGERKGEFVNIISLDRYEAMRKELENEREQALQGLMMYRYKFEELDRQVKMLPAPVEIIPARLTELEKRATENEQALTRSQETIKALEEALQSERQRSWWDRLWKR